MQNNKTQPKLIFNPIFKDTFFRQPQRNSVIGRDAVRAHKKYNYAILRKINSKPQKRNSVGNSQTLPLPLLQTPLRKKQIKIHQKTHQRCPQIRSIISVINKQISLERKRYFQTLNTERALILRGRLSTEQDIDRYAQGNSKQMKYTTEIKYQTETKQKSKGTSRIFPTPFLQKVQIKFPKNEERFTPWQTSQNQFD